MTTLTDDTAFRQGLDASLRRDYAGAITAFEDVAARYPDDPLAQKELGFAYARRGESIVPDALKQRDVDSAVRSDPDTGETSVSLRSSLSGVVQAALGLAVVRASKATGNTDWIARYREDFRRASVALERSVKLFDERNTPDAETYFALAQCLRYLGLTDSARDAAFRATELAPTEQRYAARARALEMLPEGQGRPGGGRDRPTWNDLILPARTKRELRQMQLMIEDPQLAVSLGVEPPTGLLLYGPPGTGKTTIARVLASEAKCRFFATSPAEINSMWMGESEKQVKKLFDQARAAAPAIIFLDEIDALLPSRSGGVSMYSDKVVNQFLHEMDGLRANRRIFVVGATNRRDMLDPALLRGGRLSREIEIPLPDLNGRRELLALYAKSVNLAPEVSLDDLAARTDNYSGANIRALINEAGLQALIRLAEARESDEAQSTSGTSPAVSRNDFDEAITNFNQSASQQPPTEPNPFARMWN